MFPTFIVKDLRDEPLTAWSIKGDSPPSELYLRHPTLSLWYFRKINGTMLHPQFKSEETTK